MDVHAVAHQLGDDVIRFEDRARQPGRPMRRRHHAIEEMRRLARARANALEPLLVGRAGMAQRHVMTVRDETADQIDRAVQFGRDREDPHIRPRRVDFPQDVVSVPVG